MLPLNCELHPGREGHALALAREGQVCKARQGKCRVISSSTHCYITAETTGQ